ncbi:hypothetical protein EDC30_104267 [Paucimonas lemoignei]|uniref:Uncharacterized protein n=1 Tax=Paucimonas lemoignei TaxID=29443 RepID=A0A4R3HXV6_PAULE|nr:hypothetical protein [Paucimonas lemoignei]TCS37463.1 hypothetical protein EDC30_104267 [Paucimonas lemoignei]
MKRAWNAVMHVEHGWLARHQYANLAIIFAIVTLAPGVIEWMI